MCDPRRSTTGETRVRAGGRCCARVDELDSGWSGMWHAAQALRCTPVGRPVKAHSRRLLVLQEKPLPIRPADALSGSRSNFTCWHLWWTSSGHKFSNSSLDHVLVLWFFEGFFDFSFRFLNHFCMYLIIFVLYCMFISSLYTHLLALSKYSNYNQNGIILYTVYTILVITAHWIKNLSSDSNLQKYLSIWSLIIRVHIRILILCMQ